MDGNKIRAFVLVVVIVPGSMIWFFCTRPDPTRGSNIGDIVANEATVADSAEAFQQDAPARDMASRSDRKGKRPAPAAGNELRAASAASRSALVCYLVSAKRVHALRILNAPDDGDPPSQFQREHREAAEAKLASLAVLEQNCASMGYEEIHDLAKRTTLKAAALGDADAQLCAVENRFFASRGDPDGTVDWRANQQAAKDYVDQGLDRGDWRAVQLIQLRTRTFGHGPIGSHLMDHPGDPLSFYQAVLLLRLGADGAYLDELTAQIDDFVQNINPAMVEDGRGLDPSRLEAAAAWAKQEYEEHFQDSSRLDDRPVICGDY